MSFPIKGNFIKKKPTPPPTGDDFIKSVNNLHGAALELNKIKDNAVKVLDDKIEEVDSKISETIDSAEKTVNELVEQATQELEDLKNDAIDKVNSLEPQIGAPGQDADNEAIIARLESKIPPPIDTKKLTKEILALVPKVDEKALIKKALLAFPKSKASLKIIQEKIEFDPMSVIEKILDMGDKFQLKPKNIDGLEQTFSAFRNQLSRGYLHGGGDTVIAGTNIAITTNSAGQKVITSTLPVLAGVTSLNTLNGAITLIAGSGITISPLGNTLTISTLTSSVLSVSGTTDRITSTGGVNPIIDIAATYVGQTSLTTLGTIGTGVWNGTVIDSTYGGTGINNAGRTLTISTNSGTINFSTASKTLTIVGNTAVNQNLQTVDSPTFAGLTLTSLLVKYNNISVVGWGVPAIYGSGRSPAQTSAVASVAAYTVGAADGSFEISANVNVTTSTTHNFTVTCTYTDETNTSRTLTLTFSQVSGTLVTAITNTTGAGPYMGVPFHIRCKASTAITIATTGTFTTITYNVEGIIKQMT